MTELSVGIVTYNSADKICNLLESLYRHTAVPMQVYVVDNGSTDGTVPLVRRQFPLVHVIESPENGGFGYGHNRLLEAVDSKYHAIVNPDIVLHDDVFTPLVDYLDRHADTALITPRVTNPDGSEQFLPKRLPTVRYMVLGRLSKVIPPLKGVRAAYTRSDETFTEPAEIAFCTGCFMLLRTSVFKACGGFDEQFFMYLEDADLSRRVAEYGKLVFYPGVSVEHQWEAASGKSMKFLKIHLDSMHKYMKKVRQEKRRKKS